MERWPRFRQLRRDLEVLRLRFQGGKLSPLIRREGCAEPSHKLTPPHTDADLGFRRVRIEERVEETSDVVTLKLAPLDDPLTEHRAGQFLTLEVEVDGKTYRRAYSISSAEGEPIQVSIKRIEGGIVSTYLTKYMKAGDNLRVLGPSGNFGLFDVKGVPNNALIVAGGSGITPCISIAETRLRDGGKVMLVYGSRSWDDIIFRERLSALAQRYEDRLVIDHVTELAHPHATHGRLDAEILGERLNEVGALVVRGETVVFLCGPTPMMDAARALLADVRFQNVREERFVSARPKPVLRVAGRHTITIIRSGGSLDTKSTGTLLESGLAAGVDMPFSCGVGGCAACKVKLVEGEVHHGELSCLSDEEKRQGYVLACCAEATSPCTIELPKSERA